VDMPNLDGEAHAVFSHASLRGCTRLCCCTLAAGMNIKMLLPNCEESRRLIDWVEAGACTRKHASSHTVARAPQPIAAAAFLHKR
jgi:hypothetical protein